MQPYSLIILLVAMIAIVIWGIIDARANRRDADDDSE